MSPWERLAASAGEHWRLSRGAAGGAAGQVDLLVGDVRAMLRRLSADSVHCVCCSPPYWSQRAYGTEPQVWGEPNGACPGHVWQRFTRAGQAGGDGTCSAKQVSNNGSQLAKAQRGQAICQTSGCWLGELGSEPTVELFIRNLVEVFREVRRVLHPTGVLVINLGASYAGSGKGPTGHSGIGDQAKRQGFVGDGRRAGRGIRSGSGYELQDRGGVAGWKPKDLILTPFFLAEALRQDGWWLRSFLPWPKANCMPESVTDRPVSAIEWVMVLSKRAHYY